MKIAILGAGITGLTTAYCLSQKNHEVVIFEKEDSLGGLSGCFKNQNWNWGLEKFYHHFFSSDNELFLLSEELGIKNKLKFKAPITSIFIQNKIYRFDSPKTILNFPLLTMTDKLRTGAISALLKINPFWQPLEKISASDFIKKTMGSNVYHKIWEPLLQSKFGDLSEEIPASWFWTRVKKRSFSLGYFEGGNQILIDKLAENIKKKGGRIILNSEVKNLKEISRQGEFDKIIITAPAQTFLKIVFGLPKEYLSKIQNLKMIGCLNLVLSLKEKFLTDNTYWLNINESNFPFVAVVEHSNFIDSINYNGEHLLYVGGYYPQNHRYFKMTKEEILKEFLPYLKKINPAFDPLFIIHDSLFTNKYAQPIPSLNYSRTLLPSVQTPIPNLYWTSLHHVYPQDRGINYAIKLGKRVAKEIINNK